MSRWAALKSQLLLVAILLVCTVLPSMFWHDVWFGRVLDDWELGEYLADEASPRRIQHALAQLGERMDRGEELLDVWPQRVLDLTKHGQVEIRTLSAWVMGKGTDQPLFRQKLLQMLSDPHPLVRRNAALSLVRFGDSSGRPELQAMLGSFVVESPFEGKLSFLVEEQDWAESGSGIARITTQAGVEDVDAPVSGQVESRLVSDDSQVKGGAKLLVLLPDPEHVWESLRAFYLVGTLEDLPLIESLRERKEYGESLQRQIELTREAILERERPQEGTTVLPPATRDRSGAPSGLGEGEFCCCPALSSEFGLILPTSQVVRGSVGSSGLGMIVDGLEIGACDLELVCNLYLVPWDFRSFSTAVSRARFRILRA